MEPFVAINSIDQFNGGCVAFLDMRGTEKDLEAVIDNSDGAVELDQGLHVIPELDAVPASSPSWGLNRADSRVRTGNQGAGTHNYILATGVRTTHSDFGDRATPQVDFTTSTSGEECNGNLNCRPEVSCALRGKYRRDTHG